MTTYYVSPTGTAGNSGLTAGLPKSVASALATMTNGDVLSLADGDYPRLIIENKTIGVCATTLPTATVVPGWASPHPARTTKGVRVDTLVLRNSPLCTFFDLDIVLKQWIDTTDGTHTTRSGAWHTGFGASDPFGIIGQDETSHHPVFTGCEVRWGYGPTQAAFDPSMKYPEFQSGAWASSAHNAVGHGDPYQSWWQVDNVITGAPGYTPATTSIPNGRAYNTIAEAPYGFSGRSEADAPEFIKCHFHDMNKGIVASTNRGRLVIDQCWFERMYSIIIQLACDNVALSNGFQLTRNLYSGVFNSSLDSGNPHGDILQHFVYIVDADPNKVIRLPNVWIERNFWISRPTDRGFAQFLFLQGGRTGSNEAVYVNPLIRDNLALQKGNNLGIDPSYIEDGVLSNNMAVGVPGAAQPSAATIGARRNTKDGFAGLVVLEDNIAEGMGSGTHLKATGNVSTGQGYSAISIANLYTGTFPPSDNSLPGWYAATIRKGAYAAKGPRFATLYAALTDPLSTANVKVFVGWASKSLMPKGQLVTGLPSAIRGPFGDNVTVSTDIGQFRIINPAGTVVTDWTSTPTVTAVGNRVVPHHTSSTSFAGLVTQTITLTHTTQGALPFQFKSTTMSNIAFPKIGLAKTGVQLSAKGALGTDTKKAMMAAMFRLPEITVNNNAYAFGHLDNQTGFRARVLPTATGNTFRISAWNSDGVTSIFGTNVNSGEMNLTSDYLFILSLDTALGAAGFSAAIWDMTLGGNPIAFNTPPSPANVAIGFSNASGASANRCINNGVDGPGMHLSFYMLALNQWLDANDPESVRKLMAAYIGGKGKGVFGTQPELFITGDAAKYNAGNYNLGASPLKFSVENGAVTDVATAPWPPVLALAAEVLSPTPFVIDQPVTIQITPAGYAEAGTTLDLTSDKAGVFSVDPVTLPEGTGGVTITFTPRVSGSHAVTGVHSGSYTAFETQTLAVTDPYTYIAPGASASLNAPQRASLQARAYNDTAAMGVGPVGLRWNRDAGNSGPLDGTDLLFNLGETYISVGDDDPGTWDIPLNDPLLARQGSPGQVGYSSRAMAGWTTPMYDRVTGTYVVGLTAWHAAPISNYLAGDVRGIKEVRVKANNGLWYFPRIGTHPVWGNECYQVHVRASDMPSSGVLELIAVVTPHAGLPFVLQGQPDARTINVLASTGDMLHRVNQTPDMWSMLLHVDKTGTDLPSAHVYKASDDDPAGNDGNDGLTAATPLKTWEAAISKIKSIHGTPDVGGAIAYLTASQNHEFGLSAPSSITLAANSWLRVMPAPGLARADVKIARKVGTRGLYCERVSIENILSAVTLENYNPDAVQANNYMHMRVVGISHDGGAGVDVNGQPNGPQFVQAANGHLQALNCTVANCYATGFNALTLDIGCITDNLSENRDMTINPKVSIRFKVKNQVDLSGGNHCDAMSFTLSRRMHIVEDLDVMEGNRCEGLFHDSEPNEDMAFIRPRVDVGTYTGPSVGFNGTGVKPKNYLIVDPVFLGGTTQIWANTPPYAVDCRMILTADSVAGNLSSQFRYGFSVIGPSSTTDPDVAPPPENEFVTLFGANVVDTLNAATATTLTVDGNNFVTQWRADIAGGGPGPYAVPAAPNRPTYNPVGFNGHPTVDCVAGFSALGRGSTPDSIEGTNPCEIFLYGRHDELPASTLTRTLFSYGGAASASSRYIRRTVVGGVNKASFLIGASSLVAPGDFSGEFILHVFYDAALGYGIGLYNSAQPNGLYTLGTLGAAPATGNLRVVMGGDFNDTQGVATSRWGGGFAGHAIIDRVLTTEERAAAIAVIRAKAGF